MIPHNGALPSASIEALRSSLAKNDLMKCPLCSRFFEEPVVLNCCSHRFCRRCLNNYNKSNGPKCPNCEHLFGESPSFSVDRAFLLALRMTNLNGDPEAPCSSQTNGIKENLNASSTDIFNIVLWPDASVYDLPLPSCAKRPRYIQVPDNATVEHLIEFLFIRLQVEGNLKNIRQEYKIRLTNVIKERENVRRSFLPQNASFLCRTNNNSVEEPEQFPQQNVMISIRHPFQPLDAELTAQQLIDQFWIDMSRPLKLVFKLTALK